MRAIGSAIWSVPRAIGRGTWRVFSLIHNWDEVHETYPEVDTGPDSVKLTASNMAGNMIGSGGSGAF